MTEIQVSCAVAVPEMVGVDAGDYPVGEGAGARIVRLPAFRLGAHPVTNADFALHAAATGFAPAGDLARRLADPVLAGHPVTGVTLAEAQAFCAWLAERLGEPVRLPTGDEWEAAARGPDGRTWPWGDAFDADACNSVEAGIGFSVPVDARPAGASWCGAKGLAGNVWEWTSDRDGDGWCRVRGGSWLDSEWGVRAARVLPADPGRATPTTGFRLAIGDRRGRRSG